MDSEESRCVAFFGGSGGAAGVFYEGNILHIQMYTICIERMIVDVSRNNTLEVYFNFTFPRLPCSSECMKVFVCVRLFCGGRISQPYRSVELYSL